MEAFCLFIYLTGVHFRDELQHGGDASQQEIKCRSIRTQEIGGLSLSEALYEFDPQNCHTRLAFHLKLELLHNRTDVKQ